MTDKSCINCRRLGGCNTVDDLIYSKNYPLWQRREKMVEVAKDCSDYQVI